MKNARWIERQLKKAERLAGRNPRHAMKLLARVREELHAQELEHLARLDRETQKLKGNSK